MIKWVEVLSTDESLVGLARDLGVHPLALEDCQHRDQRPKLDDYETHQLLVWFMFIDGNIHELQFLIFPDKLVVVPHDPPPKESTWKDFLRVNNNHKDVWHLLYQALDRSTDITWAEMRSLFSKIDEFEHQMFKTEINPQKLLQLKNTLSQAELSVGHLASVARQLQNLCRPTGDLNWKLRDLYDHADRIDRSISFYRSQIATSIELYWGFQANRTNKQIKKLSILASAAVPLTFWASFWGMNFEFIPFESTKFFLFALAVMVVSVSIAMWVIVKKGYWND